MIKYELKKIFSKTSSKIAVLLLLAIVFVICWMTVDVSYVNEKGEKETGFAAVRKLRETQKEWAGDLDEERLRQVIGEIRRINATPEARSKNESENEIAYSWQQGIDDIRDLLNRSFGENYRSYDYYRADSLNAEDAALFYSNRIILLKNWLADEAKDQYTDREKEFLIGQYESLKTPIFYDYMRGWSQLFDYSPKIIMITILILGFLVAGIFSNEFAWKSDPIFFSTVYGRNKAVAAKIKAGACMVTVLYWAAMLLYSGVVLFYYGADGAACPVQVMFSGWKSFYNIQIWQEYVLIAAGGYVGCLFLSFLTMLVSSKTKSTVLAVLVPFVLIFIPSFLGNLNSPVVNKILGLLPDRLLQISAIIGAFDLYELGEKVVGAIPILLVLYSLLAILLLPVLYRDYRRKQIF